MYMYIQFAQYFDHHSWLKVISTCTSVTKNKTMLSMNAKNLHQNIKVKG